MTTGPLAAAIDRLDPADLSCDVVVGVPEGDRWTRIQDLLDDPAILHPWFAATRAEYGGHADVAGCLLAGMLGGIVLTPVLWAFHTERRAWPLDPAALWVRRHEDGWFDGLAVAAPSVRVLPEDSGAGHSDSEVVTDAGALRRSIARDAVAVLAPLFAGIRVLAPFGVRGMWGTVADSVASSVVFAAFRRAEPVRPAYDEAIALVDELVAAGAGPITHPEPKDVTCAVGTTTIVRNGTCCLWHKAVDADLPNGERYCLACPTQPDPDQHERWVAWLDEVAAERSTP